MKRNKIIRRTSLKRKRILKLSLFLLLFMGIGYSALNKSLRMNANIEISRLKVTVNSGEYLQHGTKQGTDCPAGSFCPGDTFSYNDTDDQGLISCAIGSFSSEKSNACTPCQGKTTSDIGSTTCDTECSNKTGVLAWEDAVWNSNNSMTNICTVKTCKTGYTKNENSCAANTYTITLNNDDATTPGSTTVQVTYDSGVPTITPPTKRGYNFKGYYNVIEHTAPQEDEEILYIKEDGTSARKWDLTEEVTLVAKWEAIKVTCEEGEYLPHDATSCSACPEGSSCAGGEYEYHETDDQGSTLCQAGTYSTGGAKTCSTCSGGVSSEPGQTSCSKTCSNAAHVKDWVSECTISTCDTGYENQSNTCVAKKFNITLDNTDAGNSTTIEVTYNEPIPSITVPEKTGYTFEGYYTEENGQGTKYINADGSSAKAWDKTDVNKLYAKWTIITKNCSSGQYLPKGTTTCSSCPAGSFCTGGEYSYKANEDQGITKCAVGSYSAANANSCTICTGSTTSTTGKTSCDAECTNKDNVSDWNNADWNNNNPTGLCSIKTCTVGYTLSNNKCEASKYTVTLDNQDATTSGSGSVEVTYRAAVPNITVPEKTGYNFDGYYTDTNGNGTKYINADGTSAKNWDITTNTILYANWTPKSTTVQTGQYLPKNSLTNADCPAGSFCTGGTFNFNPTEDQGKTSCAEGSYSASKSTSCTVCTNGKTTSGAGKTSCDTNCSNKTGVSEWNTSSWNNNEPTGVCSIKSCSSGYTLSSNTCTVNSLVFESQTVNKDYNESSQTINITGASNGTGTYTYTKKSGESDITVSSAGVITIPANKAAGEYNVVITAKDSNSNATSDATYTIKINKVAATLTCSNKTYTGSEQTACTCSGGTLGGEYKATNYKATAYSASCTPDSNHTAPANATWTMSKKEITITANNQTIDYGKSISKTTSDVTVATLGTGDSLNSVALAQSTTDATTSGTITPSSATIKKNTTDVTENYSITYNPGVLTINKVAATLTCSDKTYSGSEQTACTCNGGEVAGDFKATNVGSYTASCTPDSNHTAPENKTWTMSKKAITITAKAQTITYGENISSTKNDVTTSSLGADDSLSTITLTPSTTNATTSGTITPSNATIKKDSTNVTGNYNITYVNGTLKINKANATCTINTSPTLKYPGSNTGNITYSCTGDGTINVTSSDTTVITVGTIETTSTALTANKVASATISVSQNAGDNYNAAEAATKSINVTGSTYTVTLDNQDATTPGSTSVTATYASAVPNITIPEKTGYDFGGYYTETNGAGTQYIKADGTSAKNWDKSTNTILYAKWTLKTFTCNAGQYLAKSSTTCSGCQAGNFCPGGTYTYNTTTDQGKTACAEGSYSTDNSSSCTACTGKSTSGTGQTSCNAECSNKTGVDTWTTASWTSNTVSNLCKISTCTNSSTTSYVLEDNACIRLTAGMLTYSNSGNTTCTNAQCSMDELFGMLK